MKTDMTTELTETKIIKHDGFTTMNNHHLFNRNLSNKAKGLLSLVLALSPDWQYSIAGLTSLSTDGKDAIMSELNELRAEGYFYSQSYREGGRYRTKYYFANTPELLKQEIDRIGKTESVNRKNRIGKTESVNPQLLNTNNQILKNNTPKPPKGADTPDEEFECWYNLYDKKAERQAAWRMWQRLTAKQKQEIIERTPAYVASTPDKKYRMNPATYINPSNCRWQDELITRSNSITNENNHIYDF